MSADQERIKAKVEELKNQRSTKNDDQNFRRFFERTDDEDVEAQEQLGLVAAAGSCGTKDKKLLWRATKAACADVGIVRMPGRVWNQVRDSISI